MNKRIHDPDTCISFLRVKEEYGGLSNMAGGFDMHLNGIRLRTVEHLHQALKFPLHPSKRKVVVEAKSPIPAKRRACEGRKPRRERMDMGVAVLRFCLRLKLLHDFAKFGDLLESTCNYPIVEKSGNDLFWGAVYNHEGDLWGTNAPGRLLMELRANMRDHGHDGLMTLASNPGLGRPLLYGDEINPQPREEKDNVPPIENDRDLWNES